MNTPLIWLLLVGVGLISFFVLGLFNICLRIVLQYAYDEHQKLRRQQRPSRIFLIRHGESEANVDTSKIIICEKLISFFFTVNSFIFPYG
jgi:hypothetical protein